MARRNGEPVAEARKNIEARANNEETIHMSLYLTRARYTQEAFKGMLANPASREGPAKTMFEAAGKIAAKYRAPGK
jgi:hypothetical protein